MTIAEEAPDKQKLETLHCFFEQFFTPALLLTRRSRSGRSSAASRSSRSTSKGSSRSSSGSDVGRRKKKPAAPRRTSSGSGGDASEKETADAEGASEAQQQEKVGEEDIFGSDVSVSSDEDDKMEEDKAPVEATPQSAKTKRRILDDDDEDDVQRYEDDEEKDEDDEKETDGAAAAGGDRADAAPAAERVPMEEDEPVPETRIDVEVPKISTNLGEEVHFVKLPNFLSVDCRPFDPDNYEDEIEDEDSLDEEGRARLKLKVENTIRWRIGFDEEGKTVRESNARVVKWSDGSMSLHLGNEIFDVYKQPLQGDFNHLFIRQGTGLQGQAVFRTKLSFRPHSTDSFTHQKLTRNMADRSNKAAGIKVISQVGRDPEANRYKRVKEEEERLRAAMRRDSKQRRVKERSTKHGLSSGYLEGAGDSDDEGGVSLAAIKNRYKGKKGT